MFVLLIFYVFVSVTQGFTPNCVPENQFRNFGFPVEVCSDFFQEKCKFHHKGYFKSVGDAPLVKILITDVIPTCAFYNAERLRNIYGVNSKIKVLATGAFINLPNLEAIHLEFNYITEIKKDIFKNVSVELLDLSWNKIAFIDSQAFREVSNLRFLNLSRNSLQTLSINHLGKTIESVNLAYNLLGSLALNSHQFTNLTLVDVSNNQIDKVAISFKYPAEKIDLTNNRLHNFDYMDISSVNQLKIGKNLFADVPQYMENMNVQEIDIYPNPWKCDQLFLLWETLVSFNIRLAPRQREKNPAPECSNSSFGFLHVPRSTPCEDDYECPSNMACRGKKCWDPCRFLCHPSNLCETRDHAFQCSCAAGQLVNPLDVHGECKDVECFASYHCMYPKYCVSEKCISVGGSGGGHSGSGSANGGHASGSWGGGYGIVSGSASGTGFNSPGSFEPVAPSGEREVPWWFEEIPSVEPPTSSKKTDN